MEATISGKPQLNRRINANLVFGVIRSEGPISRADLAKVTGIRSTSISAIVQQLMDENLVREIGRGESTGGRHPIMLEVNPSGLFAAGIEVGEDELNGVIVDLSGKLRATENLPLPDTSVETVITRGSVLLERLCRASRIEQSNLNAVGIAVPGLVTQKKGNVLLSQPLGWQNVPIKNMLEDRWDTEVHVLNNAMAGAMAEYFGGMGQGVRSLLYLLIYLKHVKHTTLTSLGCGIVLDGRAYFGEGQMAGELRVDIQHPLAHAAEVLGDKAPRTMDDLVTMSRKDPGMLNPVWAHFAEEVGSVIGRGVDFLSPGRVIIGTDTPEISEFTGDAMQEVLRARSVAGLMEEMAGAAEQQYMKLFFAPLHKDTLARGAIVPRLQELSLMPLLRESVLS